MIFGLIEYDRVEEAEKMFTQMATRNVISSTAIIDGLRKIGKINCDHHLFDEMTKKKVPAMSIVMTTAIILDYYNEGRVEDAREPFTTMHGERYCIMEHKDVKICA